MDTAVPLAVTISMLPPCPTHLVVEVDADHGIAALLLGRLRHLGERQLARIAQLRLVGGRTSADNVADAGEEILEDVGADDRLAGDDAPVVADVSA